MKTSRSIAAVALGAAAVLGTVAAAPAIAHVLDKPSASAPAHQYEEHEFTGSSTSADAFRAWFGGKKFVKPYIETMDLVELEVNDTQTAQAGDIIYKDEDGNFWIK